MIECDGMRRIHVRLVVVHILYPSVDQHHQKSLYTEYVRKLQRGGSVHFLLLFYRTAAGGRGV